MNQAIIDRLRDNVSPEWRYIFNGMEKGCIKRIANKIDYARHFKLTPKTALFTVLKASSKEQYKWIKYTKKKIEEYKKRKLQDDLIIQNMKKVFEECGDPTTEYGMEKRFSIKGKMYNEWASIMTQRSNLSIEEDVIEIIKCKNAVKRKQLINEAFCGLYYKERK